MKLYTIFVKHSAPKDSHTSIECYAIVDLEEQLYEKLDKELHGNWSDKDKDEDFEDDDYATYKDLIIDLRGDINDPWYSYEDSYYGITQYGWDEGKEVTEEEVAVLQRLVKLVDLRKQA